MANAAAAGDQHDIFRVIIAKHGDRAEPVVGDRLQALRATRRDSPRRRRPAPAPGNTSRGTAPPRSAIRRAPWLRSPSIGGCAWRWMRTSVAQLVKLALPRRIVVERFAQPPARRNRRAAAARLRGRGRGCRARSGRRRSAIRRRRRTGGVLRAAAAHPSAPRSAAHRRPGNSGGTTHRRQAARCARRPSRCGRGIHARDRAESSRRPSALP